MTSTDGPGTGDTLRLPPVLRDLGLGSDTPPTPAVWRELVRRLAAQTAEARAVGGPLAPSPEPPANTDPLTDPLLDPWYRQAVAGSPDPIFVIDLAGTVRTWNPACERVFGYAQEVVGAAYRPFVTSPDEAALDALCDRVAAGESVTGVALVYRAQNGGPKHTATCLYPLRGPDGSVTGCVVANTDVSAHRRAETELAEQRTFYEHILDSVPLEIVVFSPERRYRYVNPAAIRDDGVRAWIIGKDDFEYCEHRGLEPAVAENRRARFDRAVTERRPVELEERFVTADGTVRHFWRNLSPVYGPDGTLQMVLGYGHDVTDLKETQLELRRAHAELEARVRERTEELRAARAHLERVNERLQHDALHDPLTGLPNRALFYDRLTHAIERTRRHPERGYAVLFLDTDNFKEVNDTFGHATGDALLMTVGVRLRGCVRPADTVARLGGDEFTVLLEDAGREVATGAAARIEAAFSEPLRLGGVHVTVTLSIGVVTSAGLYGHPDEVLRDADLAMYRAKAGGRARYEVFASEPREDSSG